MRTKQLYYGDNLHVLKQHIKAESIDLCYIDPPFNSKRNYNIIYINQGQDDAAQRKAFEDVWNWQANEEKLYKDLSENARGLATDQLISLMEGYVKVLGKGDMASYLLNMAVRVMEIHRVLKSNGSFYFHCDPTASHYIKLILDAIFVPQGGEYQNELIWTYGLGGSSWARYSKKHDNIFFYTKTATAKNKKLKEIKEKMGQHYWPYYFNKPLMPSTSNAMEGKEKGMVSYWTDVPALNNMAKERLGYDTQKPEALLERIIKASCPSDGVVLDAFCGCGTTVAVAERLNRRWIGVDLTYHSIALILKRFQDRFNMDLDQIQTNGVPKDIESARALAHRKDDKTRKEFEKWAVLNYTNYRGIPNEKKGGDGGIDGIISFIDAEQNRHKVIISVKSSKTISPDYIRQLDSVVNNHDASMGVLITLDRHENAIKEAKKGLYGTYTSPNGSQRPKLIVVDALSIINGERFPFLSNVTDKVKSAEAMYLDHNQTSLLDQIDE